MRMSRPMVPELLVLLFLILISGVMLLVYWMSR
jgi:hypothetical protein